MRIFVLIRQDQSEHGYIDTSITCVFREAGVAKEMETLEVAEQDNVPNWKDVSPRLGAAYDLFSNGRTSLKVALGRYVISSPPRSPLRPIRQTRWSRKTNRTWNDINGNYVPDCDLKHPLANGECGQFSNLAFGTVQVRSRYDDDVLTGYGVRPYNWQVNTALQQELRPGVALNVGY